MITGIQHINILMTCTYSIDAIVMKAVISDNTILNAPAYEKSVAIIIITIVPFNKRERRSGSGVQTAVGATINFTVAHSDIFSDLPADSITIKVLNGYIFNYCLMNFVKVYTSGTAAINHIVTFPVAINCEIRNPDIIYINCGDH